MPWRPRPNDRFYRFIVRTGLALRWLFRIRVIVTGQEHLPTPEPSSAPNSNARRRLSRSASLGSSRGASRPVGPGRGAVFAITHFGYLDFAFAELLLWRRSRPTALPGHAGGGRPLACRARRQCRRARCGGLWSGIPAYDAAVARLRAGEYIAILPEAGVSRSFRVRECKTGAVRMAAEAWCPVRPVSVWGAHRLMTRRHGFSPARAWRAPVRIHVGEPVVVAPSLTPRRPPSHCAQPSRPESMLASLISP